MQQAIFGAAGFIGRHLTRRLCSQGHAVFAYDVHPEQAGESLPVPIHRCDAARDLVDPTSHFGGETVDVCYYLAQSEAYRTFPIGAGDLFETNVVGALRAAEAAASAGCKLFVYGSTGSMYLPSDDPIPETGPIHQHNPFVLSKVAAEQALMLFQRQKPKMFILCARMFGVFGPGQKPMLVQNIGQRVRVGQPIKILPHRFDREDVNGVVASVIYIDDLLTIFEGLTKALTQGQLNDHVLNIGPPSPTTTRAIAEAYVHNLHKVAHYVMADRPREGDLIADISRLSRYMTVPQTPITEAVRAMLSEKSTSEAAR